MPHWILKAIVQGTIARSPRPNTINHLFQRFVTRTYYLTDSRFEHKLMQCRRHLDNYHSMHDRAISGTRVFELGTGSDPIVPIGLWLCGSNKVFTHDIVDHLRQAKVRDCLAKYIEFRADYRLLRFLPDVLQDRMDMLHTIYREDFITPSIALGELGIVTIVGDARRIPLDSSSIDLVVSNDTLEHIPYQTLLEIFEEFARITSPSATMSHFISMGDHYASFDHSITSFNFYKFSNRWWKAFNNELQYQNRLRLSDYKRLHEVCGFSITTEKTARGLLEDLDSIRLASQFLRYSVEDLTATSTWLSSIHEDYDADVGM